MYTDVAINIAGRELQKKGMNISGDLVVNSKKISRRSINSPPNWK